MRNVRRVAGALLIASLCAATAHAGARCPDGAPLSGTFLQPTTAVIERDAAAWDGLFADIARLGMKDVYLQWSAADGVYEGGEIRWPRAPAALARRVLDAAQ